MGSDTGVMQKRVPTEKPPFTLGDIRKAIPPKCFERSTLKSFSYLLKDVAACAALWYAATWIEHPAVPTLARYVLWPLYWFWMGAFGTGIWVVAHECGHQAFSDYGIVNDTVGLVFHSLVLVPYFSWKHSHRRHHQNTGSVARDEVFVPKVHPAGTPVPKYMQHPLYRFVAIIVMQSMGWWMYLTMNTSGREYDRWANHFDPYSPIFTKKERIEIVISDIGVGAVLTGLAALYKAYGFVWLLKMYIIPYMIVNHWLVMITFLQHTHPNLPHYDDKEWDWLRGALATVDRTYGFLDGVFHNITDTHVAHHLFSYMPHYHAQEATEAIKKVVGDYYAKDTRNVWKALWQDFRDCTFVTPDKPGERVLWYH